MTAIARRLSRVIALSRAAVVLLWFWLALLPLAVRAQGPGAHFIPGEAKAGMRTFFDKGCARCHAVLGEGGRSAPDLARAPAGHLGSADLVAAMWNHAPAMWEKMRVEHVTAPKFSESEMANLFAFLYSVRSFDEPGDPDRGRQLLSEKRCLVCHAIGGQGGRLAPDLKNWASYRNPVSWVQAMWNHAPAMRTRMAERGLPWPELKGNDVADLIAFLRTAAPKSKARVYLRPADPDAGRRVFRDKGCIACHGGHRSSGSRAPDFSTRALPRTLGQFAGLMWNHAPAMSATMQAQQIKHPQFSNKEMADLIAYLFAERYFETAGSVERGRRIFEDKGCSGCHQGRPGTILGPDLAGWRESTSPIRIATALWNHGPLMFEKMKQQQMAWPRFRAGEIVDLMEFLNRAPSAQARGKGKQ